jgi:putative tricarboxylic transport membrane protein
MLIKHLGTFVATAILGGIASAGLAIAQDKAPYPVDTVTLVTHSSPGGGSDVYLREMTQFLQKYIDADFQVENIRGGSGAKAIAHVATAKPDGSVFYGATPTFINMSLLSKPDYGHSDIEPVVNFFLDPQVIYVVKDSPYQSLEDVIADAKARPGLQTWGTGTPAALERQALEKVKKLAGVDVTIVTHDGGGDMMINVLNGTLNLGIGEIQEFRGQLDAGEVRVIASFTEERLAEFPDAKTAKESGIDMVVNKFRGLVGPKGMDPAAVQAWETAMPKVLADPDFKKWYEAGALVPAFMPQAEFGPFVNSVVAEQAQFFKDYGINQMD